MKQLLRRKFCIWCWVSDSLPPVCVEQISCQKTRLRWDVFLCCHGRSGLGWYHWILHKNMPRATTPAVIRRLFFPPPVISLPLLLYHLFPIITDHPVCLCPYLPYSCTPGTHFNTLHSSSSHLTSSFPLCCSSPLISDSDSDWLCTMEKWMFYILMQI